MTLADDPTVVDRVLDHIANKTSDRGSSTWREPVENYRRLDRFDAELQAMRRHPTPFCPSAALPEAGSYVARTAAGTPIVAVRGADGMLRAFRNACRHRGMQVAAGCGCAKSFVCGYHGWTYRLDGALRHVPHSDGFPGLDASTRGLVAVAAFERHGLVWVNQDGDAAPTDDSDVLAGVITSGHEVAAAIEQEEPTNWKILVETFLEGYHIRSTHSTSFYPVQYDNLNLVEPFGENSRVTFPYRSVERLADTAPGERSLDGKLTFVYHLFPNVVIATFPDRMAMFVLEPLTVDRSVVVTYGIVEPRRAGAVAKQRRDEESSLLAVGLAEDFELARAVQRGLASGANDFLEFGLYESAIGHFHHHLDQHLDAALA